MPTGSTHVITFLSAFLLLSVLYCGQEEQLSQAGTKKGRGDILPPLHKEWKLFSNRKEGTANPCRDVGESACMMLSDRSQPEEATHCGTPCT